MTGKIDRIPEEILNATLECKAKFLDLLKNTTITTDIHPKTLMAGYQYIKNCVLV